MTTEPISETRSTGPTFLVVDDDAMVRKIVVRGLARLDPAEVLEVADGISAQAVLLERDIDVVVTDVLMPNMSGLELMKWAQEHSPGPLWIVLSGLETFDAAVDALQLGAFDYLAKPPEVQRLRVSVRNALDQLELVRERKRLYQQIEHSNFQLAEQVKQLEEQAAVIQSDLDRAEVIQRALLPQEPPELDGWCVEALYRSGSSVGGDFYNVLQLDREHLGLVIADAAGHGVAAAMLSVLLKLRLKLTTEDERALPPAQVLASLNRKLFDMVSAPGAFITAVYVLLNRRTGKATMASAGHPPLIWTSPAGESRLLERTGPALGLGPEASYSELEIQLDVGDRLLMYTDGVLGGAECHSCQDLIDTLCSGIERCKLPGALYRDATQDSSCERDDITVVLLERGDGASHFDDTPCPEDRQTPPTTTPQPQLAQGTQGDRAFIKISGTATWTCSQALLDTASSQLEQQKSLVIDLADCEYLDSTCLGTLHEIVMCLPGDVQLQFLPARIQEMFVELSMDGVLRHSSADGIPLPKNMLPLLNTEVDPARQGALMLSAHETLAALSPENREQFQGVVDSLRADLAPRE